jgi:hypothetical protein
MTTGMAHSNGVGTGNLGWNGFAASSNIPVCGIGESSPVNTSLPHIFVSYSHKDEHWKSRVVNHLKICCLHTPLELWDDRRICAGQDWRSAINTAISSAAAAVLLVSANSLTSDFILQEEVKQLLKRREEEGLPIFAIVIAPCAWETIDWLKRMQLRPVDGKPLSTLRRPKAEATLSLIAIEVRDLLARRMLFSVRQSEQLTSSNPRANCELLVETGTSPIEITINRAFSSYTQDEQMQLLAAIGSFLGIEGEIKVVSKRPGSVKLTLALSPTQAERLYWAVHNGDFAAFAVSDAILRGTESQASDGLEDESVLLGTEAVVGITSDNRDNMTNDTPVVTTKSIYQECIEEENRHKWIESEKAGYNLGVVCIRQWVRKHWMGFLRARWVEHLQGKCFWVELDRGDFGLLEREFKDEKELLDSILDQLKAGKENLHIILWAIEAHIPLDPVLKILTALDVNGRRLVHRFDGS